MPEELTLTTPISISAYTVVFLSLDWINTIIKITVIDGDNRKLNLTYEGAIASALMIALNKADFSVNSFHKSVLQQLVADGKLPAGTVTGVPD